MANPDDTDALQRHALAELRQFFDAPHADELAAADRLCALCEVAFDVNNPKCPQQIKEAIEAYKKARHG